jgi:hypothetical protein
MVLEAVLDPLSHGLHVLFGDPSGPIVPGGFTEGPQRVFFQNSPLEEKHNEMDCPHLRGSRFGCPQLVDPVPGLHD